MTPFLEAHRVFSRFYLLSPGPSPISIRDQMLRGRLIVEELNHEEIINKDKPLLVVGGGAGGVTAAMFAAQNSIPTTLVERKRACFSVQKLSSRFIHPNQYDWPVDHYTEKEVLFRTPLIFRANKAKEVANDWETQLGMFATTNAHCQLRPNTEITNIQVISDIAGNDHLLRVTFNEAEVHNFSAVIWATGAGSEDCQFRRNDGRPVYEGIKFWDNDQFASER
jgi:thioredoxin reductase